MTYSALYVKLLVSQHLTAPSHHRLRPRRNHCTTAPFCLCQYIRKKIFQWESRQKNNKNSQTGLHSRMEKHDMWRQTRLKFHGAVWIEGSIFFWTVGAISSDSFLLLSVCPCVRSSSVFAPNWSWSVCSAALPKAGLHERPLKNNATIFVFLYSQQFFLC